MRGFDAKLFGPGAAYKESDLIAGLVYVRGRMSQLMRRGSRVVIEGMRGARLASVSPRKKNSDATEPYVVMIKMMI